MTRMILFALASAATLASAISARAADGWNYSEEDRGHPTLTFSENGKPIFLLGCGHAFALHARYPGTPKTRGKASITIASGKKKMTFAGLFETPEESFNTTFVQFDLGYRRQDPALYGTRWGRQRDRVLAMFASGAAITISAGKESYQLPAIDIDTWKKPLADCG